MLRGRLEAAAELAPAPKTTVAVVTERVFAAREWMLSTTVIGYGFLGWALGRTNGHYEPTAVWVVTAAMFAWTLALVGGRLRLPRLSEEVPLWMAWLVAAFFAADSLTRLPVMYLERTADTRTWNLLQGALAVWVGTCLPVRALEGRVMNVVRSVSLAGLAFATGGWALAASPHPRIDVWDLHQQGAERLLHGLSVYGGVMQAVDTHTFGRAIDAYCYPPLNLMLTSVAYAPTKETRWAQLTAIVVGALLLRALAKRRAPEGSRWPDLLAALVIVHPRGWFTLEQAWGEPLAIPFLVAIPWFLFKKKPQYAAVCLGLLCATKQHFAVYAAFLLLLPGLWSWRRAALAGVVGAATVIPFALPNPRGLWHDLVVHHLTNPFRTDALSLTAHWQHTNNVTPPLYWGVVGLAAAWGVSVLLRRVPGVPILGSALGFGLFYLLGRQAFCNYYYLVGITTLVAMAVMIAPRETSTDDAKGANGGDDQTTRGSGTGSTNLPPAAS